jgi:hypothetical protein
MSKMSKVEEIAVGVRRLDDQNEGRIERNIFARDGEVWEALRFCKNKNGRHNRVHLVLDEENFVRLFQDAVRNGVFTQGALDQMRVILERRDPFLEVIGIGSDGTLSERLDEGLYGENPA